MVVSFKGAHFLQEIILLIKKEQMMVEAGDEVTRTSDSLEKMDIRSVHAQESPQGGMSLRRT